jgi:Cu(I)/Ag(I) efflux system periplasmic protein CusF
MKLKRIKWLGAGVLALVTAALPAAAQTPTSEGEITKIDKAQGKITLRHGEIKNLDMPPMTMVFRVPDAKLIDGLQVGAKVRFAAEKRDGNYTVTAIAPATPATPAK